MISIGFSPLVDLYFNIGGWLSVVFLVFYIFKKDSSGLNVLEKGYIPIVDIVLTVILMLFVLIFWFPVMFAGVGLVLMLIPLLIVDSFRFKKTSLLESRRCIIWKKKQYKPGDILVSNRNKFIKIKVETVAWNVRFSMYEYKCIESGVLRTFFENQLNREFTKMDKTELNDLLYF